MREAHIAFIRAWDVACLGHKWEVFCGHALGWQRSRGWSCGCKGGRAYMRQTQIAFRARWGAACLGVQGSFFVGSAGGGDGRGGFALVGLCACGGRILPFGHVGAVLQGHVKPAATGKVDGGHALGAGHALRDGQGRPAHGVPGTFAVWDGKHVRGQLPPGADPSCAGRKIPRQSWPPA